jgi:hypothetical protein
MDPVWHQAVPTERLRCGTSGLTNLYRYCLLSAFSSLLFLPAPCYLLSARWLSLMPSVLIPLISVSLTFRSRMCLVQGHSQGSRTFHFSIKIPRNYFTLNFYASRISSILFLSSFHHTQHYGAHTDGVTSISMHPVRTNIVLPLATSPPLNYPSLFPSLASYTLHVTSISSSISHSIFLSFYPSLHLTLHLSLPLSHLIRAGTTWCPPLGTPPSRSGTSEKDACCSLCR